MTERHRRDQHAGLVLSLDASPLARNNHDWHQLLELCSLFGVLIADGERVYDPCFPIMTVCCSACPAP